MQSDANESISSQTKIPETTNDSSTGWEKRKNGLEICKQ